MAQRVDPYFDVTGRNEWSIEGFFRHPDNAKDFEEYGRDKLMNRWVQGLRSVMGDNKRSLHDRKTAEKLLRRYSGEDAPIARTIVPQSSTPASGASIVIQGNHTVSFNNNSINATPEQLARPTKRPHSSTPQLPAAKNIPPSGYLADFKRAWKAMDNSKKWRLSVDDAEEDFVEDILYRNFRNHPVERAAHSWVVDASDEQVKKCFRPSQWDIISAAIPVLPEPDDWFLSSITAYQKETFTSPDRLIEYIHCNPIFAPEEYSRLSVDEREGRIWLRDSMRRWCELLSRSSFNTKHQECWYICKFWETIYDRCMETVPGGYMSRGESKSLGTCDRKDSYDRHHKKRRLVGHLYDGILRLNDHEFGAAEHAKRFSSTSDPKWVHDTLKVVKVLHDMLYRLQSSGAVKSQGAGVLQVVGVVAAGWHCQNWRMSHTKGYMCLLVGDQIREVPNNFGKIVQYFKLLTVLWLFRSVLKSGKETMDPPTCLAPDQLRELLKNVSAPVSTVPMDPIMPRSVRTDEGSSNDSGGLSD